MTEYINFKKAIYFFSFFLFSILYSEGFVQGTLVETLNKKVFIEELKEDDLVLSYNFKTSTYEYKKIIKIIKKQSSKIVQLKIKDEIIEVCPRQRFYDGTNWIRVEDLYSGQYILKSEKKLVKLDDVIVLEKDVEIYLLSLEDNYNFFVGEEELLTHNFFAAVITAIVTWVCENFALGFSLEVLGLGAGILLNKVSDNTYQKDLSFQCNNNILPHLFPNHQRVEYQNDYDDDYIFSKKSRSKNEGRNSKKNYSPACGGGPDDLDDWRNRNKNIHHNGIPAEYDGFFLARNAILRKVDTARGIGYIDRYGNVWVPVTRNPHGGFHWDVQLIRGGKLDVFPGGGIRGGGSMLR